MSNKIDLMMKQIRWWLIVKFAGKDSVIINCDIYPGGKSCLTATDGSTLYAFGCLFVGGISIATNKGNSVKKYKSLDLYDLNP